MSMGRQIIGLVLKGTLQFKSVNALFLSSAKTLDNTRLKMHKWVASAQNEISRDKGDSIWY